MNLILASGSPRRRELMQMLGARNLKIIPARGEEHPNLTLPPERIVQELSCAKAQEIAEISAADDVIIAADTIVWFDGRLFGKPRDAADAARMLRQLSGRVHTVYTGLTVGRRGDLHCETERTEVHFRELSDEEIDDYIATGEPLDKAGAYGAQGLGALFVRGIEGDFFNVMGLPLCRLGKMLGEQGVKLL